MRHDRLRIGEILVEFLRSPDDAGVLVGVRILEPRIGSSLSANDAVQDRTDRDLRPGTDLVARSTNQEGLLPVRYVLRVSDPGGRSVSIVTAPILEPAGQPTARGIREAA